MNGVEELIKRYFQEVDEALTLLSNKHEKKLTGLPSWLLCNREICVGHTPNGKHILVKAIPSDELDEDIISVTTIDNNNEINNFFAPMHTNINLDTFNGSMMFGDMILVSDRTFDPPAFENKGMYGIVSIADIDKTFSQPKKEASEIWNNLNNNLPTNGSFIKQVGDIFSRLRNIIKRKSFLERRIHRFINEFSHIILPPYKKVYFELPLYLSNEKRKADFILERDLANPGMLIELENPCHKVYKKDGNITAETTHAKGQIAEWVEYIDNNPGINASGDMSFLVGPKQRMIIIGRGLEHIDRMTNSKHTDTIIWTYDLLIKEGIERQNRYIRETCNLLGIETYGEIRNLYNNN